MRWLVTGAGGQLGHHLLARLTAAPGDDVVALTRAGLDLTDAAAVDAALAAHRPDVVVNAAAHTAVDAAETEPDLAHAVNAAGPAHLAAALARHGGRLLHVSTDYVFAGDAARPYEPGDATGPRTVYGASKLAGERAVAAALPGRSTTVRTAWVYGGPGPNFVDTMRRLEAGGGTVDVVADQTGSPTWAGDLADALVELGRAVHRDAGPPPALLHYAGAGAATWWDLARATFALVGADPDRVRPTTSAAFVRPAPRPRWSVLSTASWVAAGLTPPRPWRAALAAALAAAPAGPAPSRAVPAQAAGPAPTSPAG